VFSERVSWAVIDELASTLMFEADAHLDVCTAMTIWLDEGRLTVSNPDRPTELIGEAVKSLARVCSDEYSDWLGWLDPGTPDLAILQKLSDRARGTRDNDERKLRMEERWTDGRCMPRDVLWHERINDHLAEVNGWLLLVAGHGHAAQNALTVRGMLERDGLAVVVQEL
jgi:hypothetical protein